MDMFDMLVVVVVIVGAGMLLYTLTGPWWVGRGFWTRIVQLVLTATVQLLSFVGILILGAAYAQPHSLSIGVALVTLFMQMIQVVSRDHW